MRWCVIIFPLSLSAKVLTIAVAPFKNLTQNQQLAWCEQAFQILLQTKLGKLHTFNIRERAEILARMAKFEDKFGTEDFEKKLREMLTADIYIFGEFLSPDGVSATITARATDKDGKIITGIEKQTSNLRHDITKICDEIVAELLAKLDIKPTDEEKIMMKKAVTESTDAFVELIIGLTLHEGIGVEKNIREAINHYKNAIKIDPNYLSAYYNLGNAYLEIGEYKSAIAQYQKILSETPRDPDALNNMGMAYHHIGEYQKAIQCYKKALEFREDSDICFNMAQAYYDMGDYNKALMLFEEIRDEFEEKEDLEYQIALCYHKTGDLQKATMILNSLLLSNPQKPARLHRVLATIYVEQGKYPLAEEELKEAIKIEPDSIKNYKALADLYIKMGRYGAALTIFEEIVKKKPDESYPHYALGQLYQDMGEKEKALKEFETAINLSESGKNKLGKKELADAYHRAGKIYIEKGEMKKAKEYLFKAYRINPDEKITYDLALLCYKMGNFNSALRYFEECADYFKNPDIYYLMGVCAMKLGFNPEKYFDKVLELNPHHPDVNYFMGVEYMKRGDFYGARKYFLRAIGGGLTKELLADAYYNLGICYEHNSFNERFGEGYDWESAVDAFKKAISYRQDFFDAYYNLGYLYVQREMWHDALLIFEKSLPYAPQDKKKELEEKIEALKRRVR